EVFKTILPLLHPFTPFVTEELWAAFGYGEISIMQSPWPVENKFLRFDDEAGSMRILQDVIRAVRNLRAEARVAPSQLLNRVVIRVDTPKTANMLNFSVEQIARLCRIKSVDVLPHAAPRPAASLSSVVGNIEISLPVGDILDVDAEIARLTQEIKNIEKNVAQSKAKLDKPDFVSRAPKEVVEKERGRVNEGEAQIKRLNENLESLKA
ncbi:MAG: class I tRNA ligase family protein, partial [Synergistaceae bacterium]|nr:class I tRNA ligase family protein [Synergistaceae bacterium]